MKSKLKKKFVKYFKRLDSMEQFILVWELNDINKEKTFAEHKMKLSEQAENSCNSHNETEF